ncbi:acyloxyacyl hydrolase [Parapusillimonas granuli]|uniref:Lipid A deacylase n=1 Tax=Parapusillimonas granuli TaxID=380911 RepID=A0A853G3R3_9BURK|nr:acyloxyacyl hydrolase [Parapusillimonas granuli]MBB5215052.1 lipid A 3-O-deacylase [Parapusillimonas granuli]NYT49371.1 acyloxyacyl hydrolase [Parapusillimonas granuli]
MINKNLNIETNTLRSSGATLLCSIAAAIAALASFGVAAQPVAGPQDRNSAKTEIQSSGSGLGIQLGFNSGYRKAMLAYETPALWSHRFSGDWGRVDLGVELGVAYWDARRDDPNSMWQLSAIPILRWWPADAFYVEAGVGPTVTSRTVFAGRELGTRFQFGSYLGAGFTVQDRHRIGLRYAHYSNANIKKPNMGLDILQLTYTYRF